MCTFKWTSYIYGWGGWTGWNPSFAFQGVLLSNPIKMEAKIAVVLCIWLHFIWWSASLTFSVFFPFLLWLFSNFCSSKWWASLLKQIKYIQRILLFIIRICMLCILIWNVVTKCLLLNFFDMRMLTKTGKISINSPFHFTFIYDDTIYQKFKIKTFIN